MPTQSPAPGYPETGVTSPTIGYLSRVLPALSETFVVREIAALRGLGVDVRPFSLYAPETFAVHPEAPDLSGEVEVLVQPGSPLFWLAHIVVVVRHFRRYFRCLWRFVLASGEGWHRRCRCLAYFAVAPYASLRLRRAAVAHVHAHFANAATSVSMMAAELAGIPFSFTAHAYDIFVDDLLLPAKLSAAAFVATCSEFNVRYLREHYPEATRGALQIVRYGIDPEVFAPRQRPRGAFPLIVAVGRLVKKKGFHVLVEACAQLQASGLEWRCLIVGEGPESDHLRKMIIEFRLSDRVGLQGKLLPMDLMSYYRQADLLVMPSCVHRNDRDGIPNVLIEAMAMEIPVISTRVSGIPELVLNGETGLLVDPDDPAGLADAITRLLRDQELAQRLARAGRALVIREYDTRTSARKLLHLFGVIPHSMPGSSRE